MKICVFCSSSNAIDKRFFEEAYYLGKLMGSKGHSLINGGANVGLMEAVTIAAREAGAETTGIIPGKMKSRGLVSNKSNEVIITSDMVERKKKMREMSDAFIALPGGFGTLEEILEVMTLKQLAYHNKPIVFVNTLNFYEHLFLQFEKAYTEKFSKEDYRNLYFIARDASEAIDYIDNYSPSEQVNKWFKVPE